MGRQVRMVPADWQHPKYADNHDPAYLCGRYIPLLDRSYSKDAAEWDEYRRQWLLGLRESYGTGEKWVPIEPEYVGMRYTEYGGERPSPDDYMPDWPPEQRTHLMMYEDTSEGTPISPAFETPEELARWLADTNASAFGGDGATYDQWLSTCKRGWAVSAVFSSAGLQSGVAALT